MAVNGTGTRFEFVSKIWPIQKAECEAIRKAEVSWRADTKDLREIFQKYASREVRGSKYMTYPDLINKYLHILDAENYNENTLHLLASSADTTRDGLISFAEFQAFEALLCLPDSLYALAFQIFDRAGNGYIACGMWIFFLIDTFYQENGIEEDFEKIIKNTTLNSKMPFNFDSDFIHLHFGKDKKRKISYNEFTQLIHDFHEEHALQAFRRFDKDSTGYISAQDFEDLMVNLKSHLLVPFVQENLITIALGGETHRSISYTYFTAFISLLNNLELVKKIYLSATRKDEYKPITKEELLYQAQEFAQITPLEIDILFHLVGLTHQTGKLMYADIESLAPEKGRETPFSIQMQIAENHLLLESGHNKRTPVMAVFESMYRFSLGALAGATGATAVYPIDLVKTRMQNQRTGSYVGELMYKNSMDCFKKVIRHEGVSGLYRGLAPQLVGVAPEKAIKLTMNDLMRDKLMRKDGTIPIWAEMIAGGTAGGCQVIFTNPLEIVKIRLQVAGEIASQTRVSAIGVIKELGFFGLYKGSKACFLRDIPFSAIYFPAYANIKAFFADENGFNTPGTLLLSATLAGMPAAFFPTPADVIKTRLQVAQRTGQTSYNGVIDCIRKIWKEEGGKAFWKGAPARVLRSSPQFGVTLLTYELLQRALYVDFGGRRPQGSESKSVQLEEMLSRNPDHIGGYRLAHATFNGVESKFGLCLPRYQSNL